MVTLPKEVTTPATVAVHLLVDMGSTRAATKEFISQQPLADLAVREFCKSFIGLPSDNNILLQLFFPMLSFCLEIL